MAGDRRHAGLGTDMDGGITADDLPKGIDRPSDLVKIFAALGESEYPAVLGLWNAHHHSPVPLQVIAAHDGVVTNVAKWSYS